MQMLRIYVSSDTDAFFLYSVEINEEQYARIREEEKLLVDFPSFADKLVGLLNTCIHLDEKPPATPNG